MAKNLLVLLSVVLWRAERFNELCDLGLQDLQTAFKVPPDLISSCSLSSKMQTEDRTVLKRSHFLMVYKILSLSQQQLIAETVWLLEIRYCEGKICELENTPT